MSGWNFVYGKEYWIKAGINEPRAMHEICTGLSPDDFKNKKIGIWFELNLEKYTDKKTTKFAEIGCGLGRISHWVAPCVKQYGGIDISSTMISGAIEYNKQFGFDNCSFFESTSLVETFGNESLDMALTELVFIHLPRDEQVEYIKDMSASLKTGGLAAIQIPNIKYYLNGFEKKEIMQILSDVGFTLKTAAPFRDDILYILLCEKVV